MLYNVASFWLYLKEYILAAVLIVKKQFWFPVRRTVHTHRRFKITLPNTDKAHEKYL